MLVSIGTKNKAKIAAVTNIVNQIMEVQVGYIDLNVPSNVSEQPISDEETRQGAINRALNSLEQTKADLNFGLEGGVRTIGGKMYCCNWGALVLKDGTTLTAAGATFLLPSEIAEEIQKGKELGPVMDAYTNELGIRHSKGAVGVFTANLMDRKEMFEHIVKILIGQYLFLKQQE